MAGPRLEKELLRRSEKNLWSPCPAGMSRRRSDRGLRLLVPVTCPHRVNPTPCYLLGVKEMKRLKLPRVDPHPKRSAERFTCKHRSVRGGDGKQEAGYLLAALPVVSADPSERRTEPRPGAGTAAWLR